MLYNRIDYGNVTCLREPLIRRMIMPRKPKNKRNLQQCFVIAPIGEMGSPTRSRSDQVLKYIIRPSLLELGFDAKRADELDKPGIITSQVIQHLVNAPLVVADLTERNANVFYEIAIRHAVRKPIIQIIDWKESIPFDVAATRVIKFNHQDLDSVEEAKAKSSSKVVPCWKILLMWIRRFL